MKGAQAGTKGQSLPTPPANIVFVDIDKQTGLLATPCCPKVVTESFIAGTEPQEYCSLHYSEPDAVPQPRRRPGDRPALTLTGPGG